MIIDKTKIFQIKIRRRFILAQLFLAKINFSIAAIAVHSKSFLYPMLLQITIRNNGMHESGLSTGA